MNAILLSAGFGILMMFTSFLVPNTKNHRHIAVAALIALFIFNYAEIAGFKIWDVPVNNMLVFTRFGLFFNAIAIGSTLIYVLLTGKEMEKLSNQTADYFTLIFFVVCGISLLSSYNNLLTLFLGIEILSIPLYILTGSDKRNLKSNEAALKYFLMGAFSTGLMLMGIALMYGGTGTFSLDVNRTVPAGGYYKGVSFLEIIGLLFLMVSMSFKVSAAPFHFWTPDVYDGAPSVFTSFMATIVKAAAFIAFFKLAETRMLHTQGAIDWKIIFSIIIVATLIFGNITAVFQQSVKRMLAYSSIAQAGFMLFALFSLNDFAQTGLLLYAAAYSLATIGIFAVLVKMKDCTFEGYNGLAKSHPVLAGANAVFVLSLTGVPLTAGFLAKYYMLASVVKTNSYYWLVIVGVLFAAISAYYYFRLLQAMYFKTGNPVVEETSPSFRIGLIALAVFIIILGIFPQVLLNWYYF